MTSLVVGAALLPATLIVGPAANAAPVGQGFNLNPGDLAFILQQIKIAEEHARTRTPSNPCGTLMGDGPLQIPDDPQGEELPWGLRTVDGTCNNLVPGQEEFGAADLTFPRHVPRQLRNAETGDPDGPGPAPSVPTSYTQKAGTVIDSQPRVISNLIVDQTAGNPAAAAASDSESCTAPNTPLGCVPAGDPLFIGNTAPDVGLSAPFNSWFTLFGQFFDHGLDLVNKGGSGTVFMPLQEDDPLWAITPPAQRFMVLTRATNQPGPNGTLGNSDDVQEATNSTATFVDQSQTYTSHPSTQVFVREYALNANGDPVSTGHMLEGPDGGMATWMSVKDQAATKLGIQLLDNDVHSVPLLATDPYGKFIPGPNGYPQMATSSGLVEGDPAADGGKGRLVPANATKSAQAFLVDIAHHAVPGSVDHDHNPGTPAVELTKDADPGTTDDRSATTYDDEMLNAHFIAGDGRVNENIGLIAVHQIFHSEHNRLAGAANVAGTIKHVLTNEDPSSLSEWQLSPGVWNGERIFQAARFVTEMEYQHLAFEEFVRKVQPMVNAFGEGGSGYDTSVNPAIRAEFAHAVYRFGHSMLTETVARKSANGANGDIPLLGAFLNPPAYTNGGTLSPEQAAGNIVRGMSRQVGNEIDEFVTEALRNKLLGLPLDLASLNLARARETGTPTLNAARRAFYAESNNSALVPYTSWTDFGFNLKHRESLVNFVAAYGKHPDIIGDMATRRAAAERIIASDPTDTATPADSADFMNSTGPYENAANGETVTGVDDIDLWMGGLAEKQMVFGGLLGSTFNYVFELQMEDLQFGDRFYYLARTAGLNLLTQLEGNSFAELIQRNTDVAGLPADVFSRPDYVFNVGPLMTGPAITDDTSTVDYNEGNRTTEPGMHLSRMPGGTLRYGGPAHVVFNGTAGGDRVWSSEGDDTVRGNDGDDWMQGGDGNDNLIGGTGDDIMSDLNGDDVLKGGDGNDALSSGQGFGGDLNQGGRDKDFIVNGNDLTETFAGPGDDFVLGGDDLDTVFGDDGDDWIEGGAGPFNLLQGDMGNPFQDDPNGGHDVIDGDGGEQDFDSEGGDDIMLGGPGIQRAEGMLGFDWFAHKGDPQAANTDMAFTGFLPPSVGALRDRFDLTEGLSGWNQDDVLLGDDRVFDDIVQPGDQAIGSGHQLTGAGIDRIPGLQAVVGSGIRSFARGNIILGGGGSDILAGRDGDDIIDGDKWLNVRLSVRTDPADPSTEIRSANSLTELQADVFDGVINPGNIVIVREVLPGAAGSDVDTALYSDVKSSYTCVLNGGAPGPCPTTLPNGTTKVIHADGVGIDGTDTLTSVEKLMFSDSAAPGVPTMHAAVGGYQSATVNWEPAAGSVVNSYKVRAHDVASGVIIERAIGGDLVSTVFPGLTNGRAYRFDIAAANAFGDSDFSAKSNVVIPNATVPAAPGTPTATASNGQANVSWSAPANNGGAGITGYLVQPVNAAGNAVGAPRPATGTALVVSGLTNGTTYRFSVQARNSVGTGPSSGLSNAVTPTSAPSAPVIGNATAGVGQATANWTAPANNGGSALSGYLVRVFTTAGVFVTERTAPSNATSLNVTGLTNGTSYRFQVRADNAVGSGPFSGLSNAVTPSASPGVPSIVGASAGDGRATVNWTAPANNGSPITAYLVRVESATGVVQETRTVTSTARSLTAIGLVNGRGYRFRVAARSLAGTSAFSGLSNLVTPASLPGAARIGTAAPRDRAALVRWSAPLNNGGSVITRYRVQVLNPSGGQVGSIRLASAAARSLLVAGLANGNRYRFRVQAVNLNGRGPFSAQSNQVIPARPPARARIAPASSGPVGGRATAVARWRAPRANGGARITAFVVTVRQVSSAGRVMSRTQASVTSRRARSKVFRLPRGTYRFRVVARNKIGASRVSRWSNRVVAR